MKRKKIAALTFVIAFVFANPADAIIVIDPSNLVQNTATAVAAVRTEISTATILIKQIESTIALAKSLASVKNLASLAGLEKELALYEQLKATSTQLSGALEQSRSLSSGLSSQYGASSLSFQDFLLAKSKSNSTATQALSSQYQTVTDSISEVSKRRTQIVNQLQKSDGQTSAMQAVGAAIDVLIGQNQQLISTIAAEGQMKVAEKNLEQGSQKQGLKIINDRQEEIERGINRFK